MNHERLAALIVAQMEVMAAHPEAHMAREHILSILQALDVGSRHFLPPNGVLQGVIDQRRERVHF
jgi:hypothetical protein